MVFKEYVSICLGMKKRAFARYVICFEGRQNASVGLAAARVGWQDGFVLYWPFEGGGFMKEYIVVIDMQNDFITGALGTPEAVQAVPHVVRRMDGALAAGRTPLFTQDTHGQDYLHTSEGGHLPVPHCVEGTEGWALHPLIAPYAKQTLKKETFGCVALVDLLREVSVDAGRNLDLALCGVCTDICVVSNALLLRAHFPEAKIGIYPDGCAGSTPARHQAALEVMRSCQIDMLD